MSAPHSPPLPALPPLWEMRVLRPYLAALKERHGMIDSLALPNMRDMSPLRIEELFVNPQLATSHASASSAPATMASARRNHGDEHQLKFNAAQLGESVGNDQSRIIGARTAESACS